MSYFGIPRGRYRAFATVQLVTDSGGVTRLYRDGVLQAIPDPYIYVAGAWSEIVSAAQCLMSTNQIEIFDSTGNTALLGIGALSFETVLMQILPGGNGIISVKIDAGTRICVKPLTTPANNTEITVNFYD